jgi:hypothetical protein
MAEGDTTLVLWLRLAGSPLAFVTEFPVMDEGRVDGVAKSVRVTDLKRSCTVGAAQDIADAPDIAIEAGLGSELPGATVAISVGARPCLGHD